MEILGMYQDLHRMLALSNTRSLLNDPARASWAALVWSRLGIYPKAFRLAGSIEEGSNGPSYLRKCLTYLHCFELSRTIDLVDRALAGGSDLPRFSDEELHRLAIAGAYAELKRWRSAETERYLDHARALPNAGQPLCQTRILRASGHADRISGRHARALQKYDQSYRLTPDEPGSFFWALLNQYRAECIHVLQGQEAARPLFVETYQTLRNLRAHPVYWIENLLAQADAGILPKTEVAEILQYPGLPSGFRRQFADRDVAMPRSAEEFTKSTIVLEIDELYDLNTRRWRSGLSLEQRLVGICAAAGRWGTDLEVLRALLWPDEPFATELQQLRVRQLVSRARRNEKTVLHLKDGRILLASTKNNARPLHGISVLDFDHPSRPSFFEALAASKKQTFQRLHVEAHYGLSKAKANRLLKNWQEQGHIRADGVGKSLRYLMVP